MTVSVEKYAVIGNPIAHTKSPQIHAAFAKQTQQNMRYEAILAPLDGFVAQVRDLAANGYLGVNVTVPFKFEAFALCDSLSQRAQSAGAVNTLIFSAGKIAGDNTDGAGLVRDLAQNLGINLGQKKILLLGAGGAAQGVLLPILQAQPASLTIANRTLAKAQQMAEKMQASNVFASTFDCLDTPFDVIINATSAGLSEESLPLSAAIFSDKTMAYDMMYGRETPFMKQAKEAGANVADGLGMLVEQAAEAFTLWRGVRPQTAQILQQMRHQI